MSDFSAQQQSMTPSDLGDTLARLVWESFSDFITEVDASRALTGRGLAGVQENPRLVEEVLIFFMWAHTRATQLAFVGRADDDTVRAGLDSMHRSVFEDMAHHGTPRAHLPLFEQRVGARYREYSAAADRSDSAVGETASRHLLGDEGNLEGLAPVLTERVLEVTGPLRDFLEDVVLVN